MTFLYHPVSHLSSFSHYPRIHLYRVTGKLCIKPLKIFGMKSGYHHPGLADNSLPLEIRTLPAGPNLSYHILDSKGKLLRKGCIQSSYLYISTRMLPRGAAYQLLIKQEDVVLHEGAFNTL